MPKSSMKHFKTKWFLLTFLFFILICFTSLRKAILHWQSTFCEGYFLTQNGPWTKSIKIKPKCVNPFTAPNINSPDWKIHTEACTWAVCRTCSMPVFKTVFQRKSFLRLKSWREYFSGRFIFMYYFTDNVLVHWQCTTSLTMYYFIDNVLFRWQSLTDLCLPVPTWLWPHCTSMLTALGEMRAIH